VVAAIAAIPRDRFTPAELRDRAYDNVALPIACGQTISQPLVVARMLSLLRLAGSEHVLDVGTGSGYHAALLARLAAQVCSIERHPALSTRARAVLDELAIGNVDLFVGDGAGGLPSRAPFDAINVAAAILGRIPAAFVEQLALGGRLVAPVSLDPARPDEQHLVLLRRGRRRVTQTVLEAVRFVPLVS
jgi:protein-L-isoaspartate(D-aspartate) O-methyltransferase